MNLGIVLKKEHFSILQMEPKISVQWFEAATEEYLNPETQAFEYLTNLRKNFPVALHGQNLNIASMEPIDEDLLNGISDLDQKIQPFLISDHLSWNSYKGFHTFQKLPFPYNETTLIHVSERVSYIQSILKKPILLENIPQYAKCRGSEMTEAEFLSELCYRTQCGIILNLTSLFVSSQNLDFSIDDYLRKIPSESVGLIHLSGFSEFEQFKIESQAEPVPDQIWPLLRQIIVRDPKTPVCVEWEENIPSFTDLQNESLKVKKTLEGAHV